MSYLIFDFDGVLANTRQASAQATAHINGVDFETALASNHSYSSSKPIHVRNHSLTLSELNEIARWTAAFGEHMNELGFPLFTDFIAEVERIETAYKAVVSSGSQKYILPALASTRIDPTHILTFEDHHSKEEKIENVCRDWNIDVKEVFYFTDTLADVFELRDMLAEDKLIGVSWGYCSYDELAKVLDGKYILKTPSDIHKALSHA